VEARLVAIKKLANWLAYGWRIGGENKTVAFGKEPTVIDQATYGRLLLLEVTAKSARNDLRSAHQDLITEDTRLAQAAPRQSFAGLAREDANTIIQADVKATNKTVDLYFTDPKLKSLRITITRAMALKYLCKELMADDIGQPSRPSIDTMGLLGEDNKQTLNDAADRFDDCIAELLQSKWRLERDYDKYAKFKKWNPCKDVATTGARLTQDADAGVLHECAHWRVE
jgi:hypothetical protein